MSGLTAALQRGVNYKSFVTTTNGIKNAKTNNHSFGNEGEHLNN